MLFEALPGLHDPGTPRERAGPREDTHFFPLMACGSSRRLDVQAIQWLLLGPRLAAPLAVGAKLLIEAELPAVRRGR